MHVASKVVNEKVWNKYSGFKDNTNHDVLNYIESTSAKSVIEKVTSDTRKIDSFEEEVIMPSTTQGSISEEETEALDKFGNMGEDLASVDVSMEPLSHQLIMVLFLNLYALI